MPDAVRQDPGTESLARLVFLDGIRGLASVYVVLHHAAFMVRPDGMSGPGLALRFLLRHGHAAVGVFVVLSGYCLMRPVVHDPNGRLPHGMLPYLGRRAKRIYPPYLAALVLSGLAIAGIPALGRLSRSPWDRALPASDTGVLAAHLLLAHNLSPAWIYKIDPPMWSVATEWQLYLLFPALVWLWRRAGIGACVGAAFGLGFVAAALAGPLRNPALRELCPWFAGLFALGMAAASTSAGVHPTGRRWERLVAAATGLVGLGAALMSANAGDRAFMLIDPMVGAMTALLIVRWARCATSLPGLRPPPSLRLLESRGAVALGAISYSLYLVHYPLLALADAALRSCDWSPEARLTALVVIAAPLCVALATPFHWAVERAFLPGQRSWTPRRLAIAGTAGT